jgi:multiple sugar transport system substrate-binding protein
MAGVRLRLLCWDHPRATQPLRAAISRYAEVAPAVTVELVVRSLAEFNDEPIEQAAARADLVVFDHPMVPRAATTGALLPLDDVAAATTTVGGSADSYRWGHHTWGGAIDAACQATAGRPDLLAEAGVDVPTSIEGLLTVADDHPGRVLLPLYASDAICTLQSLSASFSRAAGEPIGWLRRDALDALVALVARADPRGFDRNPPWVLQAIRQADDWLLAPFVFGYALAATQPGPPLRWYDLPEAAPGSRASILGGAGLGVSAATPAADAARRFVAWLLEPSVQRDVLLPNGGQPPATQVWDDAACDARVGGFFSATRATMDAAFVRTLTPWWPAFQHDAGRLLADGLAAGRSAAALHDDLHALHAHHDGREGPRSAPAVDLRGRSPWPTSVGDPGG